MGSYTELKDSVTKWMHRTDTDLDNQMDTFSLLAESMINEGLECQVNETTLSVSFDDKHYTLPDDYIKAKAVKLNNDRLPVNQVSLQQLGILQKSGSPIAYAIHSGQLEWSVDIDPSAPIDGELIYYASVPPLSSNATNDVLDRYYLLYLSAMLIQANMFTQDDEQAGKWVQVYSSQLKQINKSKGSYVNPQVRNT